MLFLLSVYVLQRKLSRFLPRDKGAGDVFFGGPIPWKPVSAAQSADAKEQGTWGFCQPVNARVLFEHDRAKRVLFDRDLHELHDELHVGSHFWPSYKPIFQNRTGSRR